MQSRDIFEYAIIRIVPKVEREEFFNVGVILFSKQKNFLDMKYKIDEDKLNAFSSEIDITEYEAYLKAWKLICDGKPSGGKIGELELSDRFRWLTACRSTVIQSSKAHSGLCLNPKKALEDIFNKHVL